MEVTRECYRFFIETMRRNGETPTDILDYLNAAWGDKAPSKATVFRTFSELESGARTSLSDDARSGRPKTVCSRVLIEEAETLVAENPRITVDELALEAGVSHGSAYTLLTVYLQLTSRCARWVPHALTADQKQQRITAAHDWLAVIENQDCAELLQKIVVVDEKYFYHRSIGTKQSNHTWCLDKTDRQRQPKRTINDSKSHVICATSFSGRFYFEVLENNTVNSEVYIQFLSAMQHKFVHERHSLGWKDMLLIHDNARPHASKMTMEFLASKGVQLMQQPPYSPDFNLCDRWLFGVLERARNHRDFTSSDDLRQFLHCTLSGLDKSTQNRQFQHLKNDLLDIIDAAGDYL